MTEQPKIAVKGIYSALAAAQMEMGPALKDSTNPAFKSKYADLASVMAAAMPALNKHGICVIQPICDEDGKRYVKTVLAHEGGETLDCRVELIVAKNDMQGYGSAVTYARRYGLMAMAGIAPEDDDGNAAVVAAPKSEPRAQASRDEGNAKAGAMVAESISRSVQSISNAETMDALAAIFGGLPKDVKAAPLVIRAKDDRKRELQNTLADEIPY